MARAKQGTNAVSAKGAGASTGNHQVTRAFTVVGDGKRAALHMDGNLVEEGTGDEIERAVEAVTEAPRASLARVVLRPGWLRAVGGAPRRLAEIPEGAKA